jgi:hypothetical protein
MTTLITNPNTTRRITQATQPLALKPSAPKAAPAPLYTKDEFASSTHRSQALVTTGAMVAPPRAKSTPALGSLSKKYEATGPGTVSTGAGDAGGVSYGSYQFSSKTGTAQAFVTSLKSSHPSGSQALAGKKPGTSAFSTAWKKLAAKDPSGFDQAQHDYVKKTHYDPAASGVKSRTGLDVSKRSAALRDVLWSTAVQHGPGGAPGIFKVALHGRDPSKVSDAEIIKAVYAERGRTDSRGNLVHFPGSSKAVQRGVANRFRNEQRDALAELARGG